MGEQAPSLAVQLHRRLRRGIIVGDYPQGTVLFEQRLAEELDVSRVPVREAMPMLAYEGLVEVNPRRSAVVASWTARRVHDVFDVRLGLEVAAARLAARRVADGGSLRELEEAVALAELRLARADHGADGAYEQADANCTIHLALVAAAGNELMDSLMRAVGGRMTWLFLLTSGRDLHQQKDEHAAILDALRAGNERLAEALAFAHIEAGREPTLATLDLPG